MNYQETELLMAVILIIVAEGVFLACGGFETIKEAMQEAGGDNLAHDFLAMEVAQAEKAD